MREESVAIHHSFNPWWGCTKVSPGCDHCYAERIDARAGGGHWGAGSARRTLGEKYWAQPLRWDAHAARHGVRPRVLCATMADVFDAEAPAGERERLWRLVRATPHLDWLLLTKREGRIARALPGDWGEGYPNAWLGVTVEDAARAAQRLPVLLAVPAARRFVVCEPLLGPVDLTRWLSALDWVIAGGESGPGSRPLHPDWVRALRAQCEAAAVPFFFKQWGELLPASQASAGQRCYHVDVSARHPGFDEGLYPVGVGRAGRMLDGQFHEQVPGAPALDGAAYA